MKTLILRASIVTLAIATSASATPAGSGVLLTLPMCSAVAAQANPSTGKAMAATPRAAMRYVAAAGASDLYEIQSSQLAQQKAASDDVRRFAGMMIEHHTMTTQQVTAAAKTAGMTPPPPALEPQQAAMIRRLQGLSGAAFDAEYVRQQRMAHDQALKLHSGYAERGDTPALRDVASKAVPIVSQHIEELKAMPAR